MARQTGKYRSGWAYGDRSEWQGEASRYLTILGSAYRRPVLHSTREQAEAALNEAGIRHARHMNMVVAHVTEVPHRGVSSGYAYRITQNAS